VELPDIQKIELQDLDRWFSTLVDKINYDLQLVEGAVIALDNQLSTIDTAPIQYLKTSLDGLVDDLNKGFERISIELDSMDKRISNLEE
jgi:hypothetical protein